MTTILDRTVWRLVVPGLATLLGCAPADDRPAAEAAIDSLRQGPAGEVVAPRVNAVDTIVIEGMEQEIPVQAVTAPSAFPMGFATIVPGDMAVEFTSSAEGEAVRFEAAFAGVRTTDAALTFSVLPEGVGEDAARGVASEIARRFEGVAEAAPRGGWAVEEHRFQGERFGFVGLGQRGGRWFYFLAHYPPEFGDGMGPRVGLILSRWTWTDDGAPLLD